MVENQANELTQRAIEQFPNSVDVYDSIYHDEGVYVNTEDDDDIGQVMRFSRINGLERENLRRRGERFAGWMFDPDADSSDD